MRSLSLTGAANRAHVAPKTIKAWHGAGLISAASVGRGRGVAWLFDETTFDREIARLPHCAYNGCDQPVAAAGAACGKHRLALEVEAEDDASRRARVEKAGRSQRNYDGDGRCEVPGCAQLVVERRSYRLAERKAKDPEGLLRCASHGAQLRHKIKRYSKGRWRACPSCGGGPDWWQPWQEGRFTHCARCFRSAPDVREQRRQARVDFLETPEGRAAHERALHGAHAVHVASTAALPAEGLVPAKQAAEMVAPFINYSPSTLLQSLTTQRREPNGLARLGVYPRDVLDVDVNGTRLDAAARKTVGGQLAKLQSVLNGTDLGRTPIDTLRPGTNARILELRNDGASYRAIAVELGVSKSHVERVVKEALLAAVPKP